MPAGPESAAAARNTIGRAEETIARWPGGYGRSLWQRLTIIQDEPADLALGLWFACAGAQVQVFSADEQPWVRQRDDALMPALRAAILPHEPRLLTHPLDGLEHDNYHRRWGFSYLQGSDEDLPNQIGGPVEVVLIDGLRRVSRDPDTMLRLIHERTQWSSSIEILPRASDENVEAVLDEVRRQAIAIGFGVREFEPAAGGGGGMGLSLVRLEAPMSDHPVLGDPTIMAHCTARLDIAASLAKGRRVLDAGGWTGLGAERYLEAGAEQVVNLDISKEAIKLGRARLGKEKRVRFVQWDLNRTPLPFDDGSFDLIICLESLEHIAAQREAIAEFDRILEPGGVLLLSVPDHEHEAAWERLNRHGNAFHLHVPSREELSGWLGHFESVRWLRQTDVTGSLVFEEARPRTQWKGRFDVQRPWSAADARPQAVMALCTKTGAEAETHGSRKPRRSVALSSDLHLYTSHADRITDLRRDEAAIQLMIRRERLDWWSRANVLEGQLRDVTSGLEQARREAEEWRGRVRTDEHLATLQQRFDLTQSAIEAITTELAAARAQREREAGQWIKEINHHANILNEAQRQRGETAHELRAAQQTLSEQQSHAAHQAARLDRLARDLETAQSESASRLAESREAQRQIEALAAQGSERQAALAAARAVIAELRAHNDRLQQSLEAADAQAATERRHREQMHTELMQQVNRLSTRLDDDRRKLLQRLETLLEQSLEQVDRRCLTVEGRVYDLEDELDRPAVSPHRNGSPAT